MLQKLERGRGIIHAVDCQEAPAGVPVLALDKALDGAEHPGTRLCSLCGAAAELDSVLKGFEHGFGGGENGSGDGPAGAVRGDFFPGCLGQAVPQVPAVHALRDGGVGVGDGLGEVRGPIPAHDLHYVVLAQPRGDRFHLPVGQDVDALPACGIDAPYRYQAAALPGSA